MRFLRPAFLLLAAFLALVAPWSTPQAPSAEAAALSRCQVSISVSVTGSAVVSLVTPSKFDVSISKQMALSTGTGTGGTTCDQVFSTTYTLTSGLSATAVDLRSVAQGGNTQTIANPKYIVWEWLSGDGTCFLDRGATNGYTGFPADGASVSKNRPIVVFPATVATGASDKTLDYSETASPGTSTECRLTVIGTSA